MSVPPDMPPTVEVVCGFPAGSRPGCPRRVALPARYVQLPGGLVRRYRRTVTGYCGMGHAIAQTGTVTARSGEGAPQGPSWARSAPLACPCICNADPPGYCGGCGHGGCGRRTR